MLPPPTILSPVPPITRTSTPCQGEPHRGCEAQQAVAQLHGAPGPPDQPGTGRGLGRGSTAGDRQQQQQGAGGRQTGGCCGGGQGASGEPCKPSHSMHSQGSLGCACLHVCQLGGSRRLPLPDGLQEWQGPRGRYSRSAVSHFLHQHSDTAPCTPGAWK
jgi:hypothetical protein